MKRRPRWLSKASVLAIHERLLSEHGGSAGLLDQGALDSALVRPQALIGEQADVFALAAAYADALNRNHPCQDGIKRAVLTAAGVFLELNGFRIAASEREAVTATLALCTRELDEVGFAAWLRDACAPLPSRAFGIPQAVRKQSRTTR